MSDKYQLMTYKELSDQKKQSDPKNGQNYVGCLAVDREAYRQYMEGAHNE